MGIIRHNKGKKNCRFVDEGAVVEDKKIILTTTIVEQNPNTHVVDARETMIEGEDRDQILQDKLGDVTVEEEPDVDRTPLHLHTNLMQLGEIDNKMASSSYDVTYWSHDATQEVLNMREIQHKNIIQCIGVCARHHTLSQSLLKI